jgi:hypothetical protein
MKMEHAGKKKKQPTLKQNETGVIRWNERRGRRFVTE